ncbi:LacI family transcriptional regulator [Asanoa ishikariensis]|uniref:Transcriptional regulator, LacI family n=1 Tax=Asanoa ishikariensis TaxID=137265 RepID=A0A1H3TDU9_9ACTN|nr:LacI family DNA-binding transcriptional regulator [Asanoa ishikariensis]GIF62660.1 LacI family transcriptional regulator [Asanoa ishikariensis]SDZ48127.1 transcriptional regulator, LacI family [Asanoa ishikariensis]
MDAPTADSAPTRPLAMSDVAARAGVSHQTVSRVINRHPNVAVATRARVLAAIAELGYRPNGAARALATGSTRTIGLVTSNISQYGPAQTMLGLEHAAREAGYFLTVSVLDDAGARTMTEAIDRLATQSVDAIVALSTYDEAVLALREVHAAVPLITVQASGDGDGPAVWVDQETGAALATRHLLDLGHRTVHHVSGPAGSIEAAARASSWRAVLDSAGARPPSMLRGDWLPASGHAAGRELVARRRGGESVTAVFVANDQMAFGLLNAFHEAGLRVPDDVSVVGFDNVPEAPYYIPPLTTVRQDFAELGRRGVQLVLGLLGGEQARPCPVVPQLLVRATTAPPTRGKG